MGPAPLPPHERTWRHPSELAADERELVRLSEAPNSTRTFAIVTGTVGLLAIVALMITITPGRERSPVALDSTTTPSVALAQHAVAPVITPPPASIPTHTLAIVTIRLATPIGDGKMALMTHSGESTPQGTQLDVRLTSGPVVTAVVESMEDDVVVLSITGTVKGHAVADGLPSPHEIVTVLVDPPVTVPFGEVTNVDVDEGTPVLDDDGELVGLCTRRGGSVWSLVDVTGGGPDRPDDDQSTGSQSSVTGSSAPEPSWPGASSPLSTGSGSSSSVVSRTNGVATSAAP